MKVAVHLSVKQLSSLVYAFNNLQPDPVADRKVKVARSVLEKVILKFKKKHLELTNFQPTLFVKPKKHKFSLEYYEGHYLENFLTIMDAFPMNEYDRNVLRYIASTLNQQLQ